MSWMGHPLEPTPKKTFIWHKTAHQIFNNLTNYLQ